MAKSIKLPNGKTGFKQRMNTLRQMMPSFSTIDYAANETKDAYLTLYMCFTDTKTTFLEILVMKVLGEAPR